MAALVLAAAGMAAPPAQAVLTLVPAYTDSSANPVDTPISMAAPPGDASRIFVVERGGRVRVAVADAGGSFAMQDAAFLDIRAEIGGLAGEGGMLSMAFDPEYASTGLFYVYFVDLEGDIRIDEFHRSATNPELADTDPAMRRTVLEIAHPGQTNHYGGQVHFGPDGLLYAATGDGGGAGDPSGNARNLNVLLGKMLRVDVDPVARGTSAYAIPATNPHKDNPRCAGGTGTAPCPEVVASGLRNPFRFSFDRQTPGDLWIGDVGQGSWEEVDHIAVADLPGKSFGWDCLEGNAPYANPTPSTGCPPPDNVAPVHVYANPASGGAAVTGGYVVRDPALPFAGRYLFIDFYEGTFRSLDPAAPSDSRIEPLPKTTSVASLGEDALGRVYVVVLFGGVSRIACTNGDCSLPGPTPGPGAPPPQPPAQEPAVEQPPAQQPAAPAEEPVAARDTRAPAMRLRGRSVQRALRQGWVAVSLRCDERCSARLAAIATARSARAKPRSYRLAGRLVRLEAGKAVTVRIRLSQAARRAIARALGPGGRASVAVSVRARDGAGNADSGALRIRVAR